MDLLSHTLTAAVLAYAFNLPQMLPVIVLGAVIADTDILYTWISDAHPSLYLITPGSCTHSIAGAVVLSSLAWIVVAILLSAGLVPPGLSMPAASVAFGAVLAGALLHISFDTLAVPASPSFSHSRTGNTRQVFFPVQASSSWYQASSV
jgi:hypothetical protein